MYCPPESGNIEPNSANAKQAHSEISAPKTQTSKNNTGCGKGPAISFAVRKIEDPMTPLTSSRTESSKPSPRTSVGFDPPGCTTVAGTSAWGITGGDSIIQCPIRQTIPRQCHNAGR